MITEDIRELQRTTPFESYTLHTADSKVLYVKHPDYCLLSPGNHTLWVFSDGRHREVVATRNITRVVPGVRKSRPRKR